MGKESSSLNSFKKGLFRALRRKAGGALLAVTALVAAQSCVFGQLMPIEEDEGVTGFGLALRKLDTVGSTLYITAHPDDENNALLALLSRGKGYRTALLTLTRGDGGQNEIGPELFEALGIVRTGELMTIHRYDGARQFFSRAFEFGYSFSVEETLQKWGREEILRDIVRVIRQFRPQVVLTLSPRGAGGGQHHQASAQLAAEAFLRAGDPTQFPEQLDEGLRPWKASRLFQAGRVGMGGSGPGGDVRIRLDEFDPLLGETYGQFGARARGNHRSQGMNVLPRSGPMAASFYLANSTVDSSNLNNDFFSGIPTSLPSLSILDPDLESSLILLEGYVDWATESFERSDYAAAAKAVMTGLDAVRKMKGQTRHPEVEFLLEREEQEFLEAAEKAHFLHFDALAEGTEDGAVVPGEEFEVAVAFVNHSTAAVEIIEMAVSADGGWAIQRSASDGFQTRFTVRAPETASYSQPYWYRSNEEMDRFEVEPGYTGVEPFTRPPLTARVVYRSAGVLASIEEPVQYRWFDAAVGRERRMELQVVPRLSVRLEPASAVVKRSGSDPIRFMATVQNLSPGSTTASLRLEAPAGWRVEPRQTTLDFSSQGESRTSRFFITPSRRIGSGKYVIRAVGTVNGKEFSSQVRRIDYSHIEARSLYRPAESVATAVDVEIPAALKVGYITGVGDEVGLATEQLGAEVTYLSEDALSFGDLSQYDVIVTGIRAYLVREDLKANNHRLLEYVRNGGHWVVQYNKYEFLQDQYAPYPLSISRPHDRITVEESPVTLLEPQHPLFNYPNKISPGDWDGWVQERGLYFLGQWDDRYLPLLELKDPWPYNSDPKRGALLAARYGDGTYIYTGLAFFRQLPAGVPGAYRLWANLISLGKRK